jgi:hypothetical protein
MVCSLTSNGLVNRGNRGDCREGEIWFVPACVGVALPAWVAVKGTSTSTGLIFEDGSDVY